MNTHPPDYLVRSYHLLNPNSYPHPIQMKRTDHVSEAKTCPQLQLDLLLDLGFLLEHPSSQSEPSGFSPLGALRFLNLRVFPSVYLFGSKVFTLPVWKFAHYLINEQCILQWLQWTMSSCRPFLNDSGRLR